MEFSEYILNFENEDARFDNYSSLRLVFPDLTYDGPTFFTRLNHKILSDIHNQELSTYTLVYPHSKHFVLSLLIYKIIHGVLSGNVPSVKTPAYKLKNDDIVEISKGVTSKIDLRTYDGHKKVFFHYFKRETGAFSLSIDKVPPLKVLSSDEEITATKRNVQNFIDKCLASTVVTNSQLESLLQAKFSQSSGIMLVTNVRYAQDIIQSSTIEGKPISDYVSFVFLNSGGEPIKSCSSDTNRPEIVLSPNLDAVTVYLENKANKQVFPTIYCDVEQIEMSYDDLHSRSDIRDFNKEKKGINVTEFVYFKSTNDFSENADNIKVFHWATSLVNKELVSQDTLDKSPVLYNFTNEKIYQVLVKNEYITQIDNIFQKYNDNLDTLYFVLRDAIIGLRKCFFYCLRLCEFSDELLNENKTTICNRFYNILDTLKSCPHQTDEEVYGDIDKIVNNLEAFLIERNVNPKEEKIQEIVRENYLDPSYKIAIIMADSDLEGLNNELTLKFDSTEIKIQYFTFDEFSSQDGSFDVVFISGWLRQIIMDKIIFSNKAPTYYCLVYPCEATWMNYSIKRWLDSNSKIKNDMSELLDGVNSNVSNTFDINHIGDEEITVATDLEAILKKDIQSTFKNFEAENEKDKIDAVPIVFQNDKTGVFTFSYTFYRVEFYDDDDTLAVRQCHVDDLRVGDLILMSKSAEDDLLDTFSEDYLRKKEQGIMIARSKEWKNSIQKALKFYNDPDDFETPEEKIIRKFNECEINRTDIIFYRWFDPQCKTIGPSEKDDIVKIGVALLDDDLVNSADKVCEAIKIVRSARIKAGQEVAKQIRQNPDIFNKICEIKKSNNFEDLRRNTQVEIPLGKSKVSAYIYKVIDIGESDKFSKGKVNKV